MQTQIKLLSFILFCAIYNKMKNENVCKKNCSNDNNNEN